MTVLPNRAALALLAIGAASVATVAVAPAASASTGRAPVRVHLTKHHTVVVPSTTRPGLVKLHNSGNGELMVIAPRHHHSARELARDIRNSRTKAGEARLQREFSYRGIMGPHGNLYTRLFRGPLFIVEAGGSATSSHAIGTIHVTGARLDAVFPTTSPVGLDRHDDLSVPTSIPRNGLFRITSASSRYDVLMMVRIADDASRADVDKFVAHPTDAGLAALEPRRFRLVGVATPRSRQWLEYTLWPGHYLVTVPPADSHKLFRAGGVREVVVR